MEGGSKENESPEIQLLKKGAFQQISSRHYSEEEEVTRGTTEKDIHCGVNCLKETHYCKGGQKKTSEKDHGKFGESRHYKKSTVEGGQEGKEER